MRRSSSTQERGGGDNEAATTQHVMVARESDVRAAGRCAQCRVSRCSSVLLLIAVSSGCSPDPTSLTIGSENPPLEAVAFDLLGAGKVMFQRFGEEYSAVYVIDANAEQTSTVLDFENTNILGPSIAPNGNRVAWLGYTDAETAFDLYLTDLSGQRSQRLLSYDGNIEGPPSWTPDGAAIVFPMWEYGGQAGIFQYTLSTDQVTALHTFSLGPGGEIGCPGLGGGTFGEHALSIANGAGVAYSCDDREIYVAMSASDSLTSRYHVESANAGVYGTAWSPSGDQLAFLEVLQSDDSPGAAVLSTSVKVVDLGSNAVRTIAVVDGSNAVPISTRNQFSICWLWEENRLVFNAPSQVVVGDDRMLANLYVVSADGGGSARLTTMEQAFDHSVSCAR